MVIQRIQSFYLLLAAVLMALVNFAVPIVKAIGINGEVVQFVIADFPALFVLNLIISVILFVAIFLFKTLPLQMKVTRISIVLIITSALIETYVLLTAHDGQALWIGSAIMIGVSLIASILALRGMQHDYKLLKSYDRLR